jgi:hypothetical protein
LEVFSSDTKSFTPVTKGAKSWTAKPKKHTHTYTQKKEESEKKRQEKPASRRHGTSVKVVLINENTEGVFIQGVSSVDVSESHANFSYRKKKEKQRER